MVLFHKHLLQFGTILLLVSSCAPKAIPKALPPLPKEVVNEASQRSISHPLFPNDFRRGIRSFQSTMEGKKYCNVLHEELQEDSASKLIWHVKALGQSVSFREECFEIQDDNRAIVYGLKNGKEINCYQDSFFASIKVPLTSTRYVGVLKAGDSIQIRYSAPYGARQMWTLLPKGNLENPSLAIKDLYFTWEDEQGGKHNTKYVEIWDQIGNHSKSALSNIQMTILFESTKGGLNYLHLAMYQLQDDRWKTISTPLHLTNIGDI